MKRVIWEIDVDVKGLKEAAEKAQEIMRDIQSIATIFTVIDEKGKKHEIDLNNIE